MAKIVSARLPAAVAAEPGRGGEDDVVAHPEHVVFLDHGFAGNDQLEANAVQICTTEGVTGFTTV